MQIPFFGGASGDRSEDSARGSRELPNHLIPRCNRNACARLSLPTLILPLPLLEERSGVTRPRSGFGSVSRRVSYRVHRVRRIPRTMQGEQRTPRMISKNDRSPETSRITTRSISLRAYRKFSEPFFSENESRWRTSIFSNG